MERGILKTPHGSITIEKVDTIPDPPPQGLVVKTKFCGLCRSDIMWRDNAVDLNDPSPGGFQIEFPLVLGHEVSGEVYKLGSAVENGDLQLGDNVIVYPWIGCADCADCNNNETNMCATGKSNNIGFDQYGGYGSFVVVPSHRFVIKTPDSVPMDVACNLPCSALTTFHAISKVRHFLEASEDKKHLLVIGAGGLGLWCLQLARASLPNGTHIVCADIQKDKLNLATKNGADEIILWDSPTSGREGIEDKIAKEMDGVSNGGFHAIIDLVNSSSTASRAIRGLRKGGALAMVGLFGGSLTLDLRSVIRRRVNIFGVYQGSFSHLSELVNLVSATEMKFPPITHFPLSQLNDALSKLYKGEIVGKGVLKY